MTKLLRNTYSSLILQIFGILSGIIIPRFILKYYGSDVNGLINSITQFLSVIAFLELGVGSVVQSSLYKPLAINDRLEQSKIYVSAQKFFSKLAIILVVYIIFLIIVFPYVANQKFSMLDITILIVAMGLGSFAQYYFGIVNSILLAADQRGYIQNNIQIITIVLNTIMCILLIINGFSIQFVKLTTTIVYLARPIYLNYYVKKHYSINKNIIYDVEPIKQKWNGFAQHIAAIVLDGTDIIILTIFATLKEVSIYSVYYLVVAGIKAMFNAVSGGLQSLLGDVYAMGSVEEVKKIFLWMEWIIHTMTIYVFGVTSCIITPFVLVYTNGITDTNYNCVIFGYVLSIAYAAYCLRLPYHMMVRASGRYKETQLNYILSAVINFVSSIFLVHFWGLIGVAVGTLVAMMFQALWLSYYSSNFIVFISWKRILKQFSVDLFTLLVGTLLCSCVSFKQLDFMNLLLMAIEIGTIWLLIVLSVNITLYRQNVINLLKKVI